MTNVYAKFRNFPLRINKALGIFRIGVTRRRTRTTVIALRDLSRSKNDNAANATWRIWHKADFTSLANYLDCIDWYTLIADSPSGLEMWKMFVSVLNHAMFVPFKHTVPGSHTNHKHYPKPVRKANRAKHSLWKRCKAHPSDVNLQSTVRVYRTVSKHLKTTIDIPSQS